MRRAGRKGDYLMTDDYTGMTKFASQLRKDFWGSFAQNPLERNLQEIAHGVDDPQPVPNYRGPDYEATNGCQSEVAPLYVGLTNVPTSNQNMAMQVLNLDPSIPDMSVGCTFIVR